MRRTVIGFLLVGLLAACTSGGSGQNDESADPVASAPASSDAASSGVVAGGEASPECTEAFAPLAEMELSSTSDLGDLPEVDATVEACASLADWTAGAQGVVEEEINPNVVEMLLGIRCNTPDLANTPVCEELG
jgi:hypothetical protein